MKTAKVADLRDNFAVIAAWISDGETVAITKRGKPFAKLVPATEGVERPMPQIHFTGRLKRIWGDRVFSDEEVAAMRAARPVKVFIPCSLDRPGILSFQPPPFGLGMTNRIRLSRAGLDA